MSGGLDIFIGNLPFSTQEDELKDLFEKDCGPITRVKILEGNGYGFITFETPEACTKALEYHGTEYGGRTLKINPAGDKPSGGGGAGGGGGGRYGGDGTPKQTNTIFMRNVSFKSNEDSIRDLFSQCGENLHD
eukprot:GHVU01015218.1.p2 GENE.GHVU01015218.1~~GHVU01015218.1.p2  ORF type:complete len:133 (+),score=25.72 GHVU01015218.1:126-524(+)